MYKLFKLLCFSSIFLISALVAQSIGKGKISGTAVDAETGDPLIGANVYLENTSLGSASDLDGNFLIMGVPAGNYTLIVSVIGYAETKVTNIIVKSGEITKISVAAKPEILTTETVVVEAKALMNTEASLLKSRQKSVAVSDAVSAEAISRAGSGNAADAMKQVTGASVVEGKYVFVRGLGDRYTSTQLNGAELPSTDPNKRAAAIDLISSNLVDNIVTTKSFTPDKSGDFSGGAVNIQTKDFPDKLNISFSASTSYNDLTTFNSDGPIFYDGGDTDWLGMDDGTRALPDIVKDKNINIPDIGAAGQDLETAKKLDEIVNSFSPTMEAQSKAAPLNQSYSLSYGNQFNLFKRELGILSSLTYSRSISSYTDGIYRRWVLASSQEENLTSDYDLKDTKTTDDVLWGALMKASYKVTPNHMLSFNGMYNKNGESTARYLEGKYPYDLDPTATWRASGLAYSERTLSTYQFNGDHYFEWLNGAKINWKYSSGNTIQDEPDIRYFNSFETNRGLYGIKANIPPARYYRYLEEDRNEITLDFTLPFKQWSGRSSNIKVGGLLAIKDRNYNERHFEYIQNPTFNYQGSIDTLFSENNIGLIDTTIRTINGVTYKRYDFGLVIRENYYPEGIYEAAQDVSAYYAMLELPLFKNLKFIGGARFETTDMYLNTEANDIPRSEFKTNDVLPSTNFIYSISSNMNLRLGYNKTLARPLFREIAPYATWDFQGGDTYIGNPNLTRTLIDNYDVRWEWFSRPGEIYAVSGFYKEFKNPIERVFNNFGENTWMNVSKATVYGVELELRKKLDDISDRLSDFNIGSNVSFVYSEVEMPDTVLFLRRQTRPDAKSTRPFQGQSPYLFNLNFTYDNMQKGIVASIYYNIFGDRLHKVSLAGTPDIYEKPFGLLNFSFSWKIFDHINFKFNAKNLLDSQTKMVQEFNGTKYIQQSYHKGRTYSIGVGYSL